MLDCDSPEVTDLLAGLLEVLAGSGGWLHPGARLVERHGQLSVHADALPGEPLLRVPRAALVRIGRVEWAIVDGAMVPSGFSDDLGDGELEALFLLTGLLNQCGKLSDLMRTHPLLAPDISPEVTSALRAFRPGFGSARPDPVSLLWSSRCFRVSIDGGPAEPVAVPILELMNHDTRGATADPAAGGFAVSAQATDSDECFLDYGRDRDAISMAVVYGFADASARIAHSAPLCLEVAGVGHVRIAARGRDRSGALQPVRAFADADGVTINRLSFGDAHSPVHELAGAAGWSHGQSATVVDAVREANSALLDELQRAPASLATSAAASTLAAAAATQRRIIQQHSEPTKTSDEGWPSAGQSLESISEDDFDLGLWRLGD